MPDEPAHSPSVGLGDPRVVARWNAQSVAAAQKQYPAIDLVRLEKWFFGGCSGRVLDYGTGAGVNAVHLARCGHTVEALDVSPEMVKVARERVAEHPAFTDRVNVQPITADSIRLPFDEASFDYVVCVNVLSLLGAKDRIRLLFSEFKRVLRPGGKLILDVNEATSDFARDNQVVEEDVYLYKGVDGEEEGILTYCPDRPEKFAELVGEFFTVDDVGYTSFKYLHSAITEFIICAHKE